MRKAFYRHFGAGEYGEAARVQRALWSAESPLPQRVADIPLFRWDIDFVAAEPARTLLVSGTPRSGTTALGKMLGSHPEIQMFTELYSFRFGYHPRMLAAENIARLVRAGLLAATDSDIAKAKHAAIVGDKRPNLMQSVDLTLRHFVDRDLRIVHVVRKIEDVAASYIQRAKIGSWDASRDHVTAVADANLNNRKVLEVLADPASAVRVIVVEYSSLWEGPSISQQILQHLGLSPSFPSDEAIATLCANSKIIAARERSVSKDVRAYVEEHYDAEAERKVVASALRPIT